MELKTSVIRDIVKSFHGPRWIKQVSAAALYGHLTVCGTVSGTLVHMTGTLTEVDTEESFSQEGELWGSFMSLG